MDLKSFFLGLIHGLRDSVVGVSLLINIDDENKKTSKSERNIDTQEQHQRSRRPQKKKLKVLPMLARCCFLNGGILLTSVIIFESYLLPAVKFFLTLLIGIIMGKAETQSSLWAWIEPTMTLTFKYLWVIPLFWLCKLLNCFWFVEISDAAYRKKYGRPLSSLISGAKNDNIFRVISRTMADFLFSIQVELLFMVQAQLVTMVPVIGPVLSFLHMCLLYSLYAFEYKWINMGWPVVKRLSYVENFWPYFAGFGVLLTLLTNLSSSTVISACIFGVVFPLFILAGLEGKPYESCDFPIRLFSLVIWVTNKIFLRSGSKKQAAKNDTKIEDISQHVQFDRD